MTRALRRQEAGLTYHVFSRGIRDHAIYRDRFDRREFLRLLRESVNAFDWVCRAWCEMTTHFHLLLTTPEPNLAEGMQFLKSRYAEYFNRHHGVSGHLFRGRYGAVVVEGEIHLLSEFRYIARNPVSAGACSQPERWKWSSYAATIGLEPCPDYLTIEPTLRSFSHDRSEAQRLLRQFVSDSAADDEGSA